MCHQSHRYQSIIIIAIIVTVPTIVCRATWFLYLFPHLYTVAVYEHHSVLALVRGKLIRQTLRDCRSCDRQIGCRSFFVSFANVKFCAFRGKYIYIFFFEGFSFSEVVFFFGFLLFFARGVRRDFRWHRHRRSSTAVSSTVSSMMR